MTIYHTTCGSKWVEIFYLAFSTPASTIFQSTSQESGFAGLCGTPTAQYPYVIRAALRVWVRLFALRDLTKL